MIARLGLLFLGAVLLSGCVSSGNPDLRKDELVSQIKLGMTTKDEVRKLFGTPTVMSRHSGTPFPTLPGYPENSLNYEIWNYTHMDMAVTPITFVPIVGLFAGGANSEMNQLTLTFDDKGIVRGITTGQTRTNSGPQ